jgi:hypothetical protein
VVPVDDSPEPVTADAPFERQSSGPASESGGQAEMVVLLKESLDEQGARVL